MASPNPAQRRRRHRPPSLMAPSPARSRRPRPSPCTTRATPPPPPAPPAPSAASPLSPSSDPGARLELRFRPEDPHCHPAFGEPSASTGLVLRLARRKGRPAPPRADVVARVRTAYRFDGMADFQHVVPVHAAEIRKRKCSDWQNDKDILSRGKTGRLETDDGAVLMLIPPLFSVKDKPTEIALLPSSNAISKSMQRGVFQDKWEIVQPCAMSRFYCIPALLCLVHDVTDNIILFCICYLNWHIPVPGKINWEDHVSKNTVYWDWQMAVCNLFDERPVWPRQSLYERLHDDGMHVSQNQFRRLLFRAGYYFSTGPFRKLWIQRGHDPRKDPESRIYQVIDFRMPHELRHLQREDRGSQKQTELCKLEAWPSKSIIYLQLFELKDDFIQAEIRKPSYRSTFSRDTGWFSKHMIKTLRLQVSIRLLSLCPNEDAKILLRNAYELIQRSKKQEAICRSEQSKEDRSVDEEAPAIHAGIMDQVEDNSESEDADDEEEEDKEESDGYDCPPMAVDVGDFTLEDSYAFGEGFSNGYLEEVLRSFPAQEDGQNRPGDAANNADATDEFEIYEQSSDDEEYSDGS
ncbi:hypothetical protein ACP70R_003293 [Stipagrostis hirtigluma subsp. patula]